MDMILNSLPSRTWNRLGMNESFLKTDGSLSDFLPEIKNTDSSITAECNYTGDLTLFNIDSGMGKDMDALMQNAPVLFIKTAPGKKHSDPVILKYNYGDGEKAASNLRIHAAENSSIDIIILIDSKLDFGGISAVQTKIYAESGSEVRIYVAQLLGKDFLYLNDIGGFCEENASVGLVKLELGGKQLYAGTEIDLNGKKSEFSANIGYHVHKGQLFDMNYNAVHNGKKTESLMEVSGSLEDGAEKIFRGTIDFKRGSSGAKGTENENVLLLGDDMVNRSVPLILCKEEDVEGNHGASIGQLDSKILFYLASRGIPAELAQQMIAKSRIDAVCNKIPDEEIRNTVHDFEEEGRRIYA